MLCITLLRQVSKTTIIRLTNVHPPSGTRQKPRGIQMANATVGEAIAIQQVLSSATYWDPEQVTVIRCPQCGSEYQHFRHPILADGQDNYKAGWSGRGDLLIIPIEGECGHMWEICLGFHKGQLGIFARLRGEDALGG